ncbi:MAG: class I SAM-dependent methyltransferase [Chloroflexi bacterium]|nr:class I SAM-dependent methyltransferase [Chloroflexota bacterium]
MLDIAKVNLTGKTILEVGSGRGDTTRHLVDILSGYRDATLLVTDISDQFFPILRDEFRNKPVQVQFLRAGACELQGVPNNAVDYLVCNYTLCAINAQAGAAIIALQRFSEVLKRGGYLLIEEEFPLNFGCTSAQQIWAQKWRILKSAMLLIGKFPYNEIAPELLVDLCKLAGFTGIEWAVCHEKLAGVEALDFFRRRLDGMLLELPNNQLRTGFTQLADELREKARDAGGMEVPFYRLTAHNR